MKRERGFTLIELLVVVAIIGILSSVVLASLNSARQKGRDARRVSDIKQLQLALELYYDSNSNVGYPDDLDDLDPTFISVVPPDPSGGSNAYGYVQPDGEGGDYYLGAILEVTGQTSILVSDVDEDVTITINGESTNCDDNAGGVNEEVYCVRP